MNVPGLICLVVPSSYYLQSRGKRKRYRILYYRNQFGREWDTGPESLGLGISGVRHPPANDAADHVTATRSARSATLVLRHHSVNVNTTRLFESEDLGSCLRQMCREHCLKGGLGFRRRSTKHPPPAQIFQRHHPHATDILIHPATYSSPLSTP